jgi:hypothetical protein
MNKLAPLILVAPADIARTDWVLDALLNTEGAGTASPWLGMGVMLASGGLSIVMLGIAMRSTIGFADPERPV